MKYLFLSLVVLSARLAVSAQHDVGAKLNAGTSSLFTKGFTESTNTPVFSWQGGGFYHYHAGEKVLAGAELLFLQMGGKEHFEAPITDAFGNPDGKLTADIWRHISYLAIPVYIGYSFGRLNINAGFQANFTLASGGKVKTETSSGYSNESTSDKLEIDSYDFGPRAGLRFRLLDRFSIEANYYLGINNIVKSEKLSEDLTWKTQQMTLGLSYKIFSWGK